jgi:hypothetical protein
LDHCVLSQKIKRLLWCYVRRSNIIHTVAISNCVDAAENGVRLKRNESVRDALWGHDQVRRFVLGFAVVMHHADSAGRKQRDVVKQVCVALMRIPNPKEVVQLDEYVVYNF